MSTFNDSDSVTTLSEFNSIYGDFTLDKDKEIARLQEKIRRMENGKPIQLVPPSWMTKETEAVEQCLDEFRVAFNETKQCILERRGHEDISEDYEDNKIFAGLTQEMKEIWIFAARDVKKHLSGVTEKLNSCSDNKIAVTSETAKKVELKLWKDVDLSGIPAEEFPILEMSETVPVISAEAIKLCKSLVGTWNFDGAGKCPDNPLVPSKLVISLHRSGFFRYDCQASSGFSSFSYFRPDGKEYNNMNASKQHCTVNGDQIVCRYDSSESNALVESFRFLSENRLEFSTVGSDWGANNETYIYVAAHH